MKEIKFRAWDKKEEKMMLKGFLLSPQQGMRIFDFPNFDVEFPDDNRYVPMQYTGLKDKNGKEIYEGDILALGEPQVLIKKNGEVVFQDGCFGYIAPWLIGDEKPIPLKEYCNDVFRECVEIIGNIYENPELIKEE